MLNIPSCFCKKCPYTCSIFLPLIWNRMEGSDDISSIFSALFTEHFPVLCPADVGCAGGSLAFPGRLAASQQLQTPARLVCR